MNPISQFFILSPRGDTIVTREFRGDVPKGAAETFFRKARAGLLPRLRAAPPAARRRRRRNRLRFCRRPLRRSSFGAATRRPSFACVRALLSRGIRLFAYAAICRVATLASLAAAALCTRVHTQVDGINYVAIKKSSLYLMATTRFNVRPAEPPPRALRPLRDGSRGDVAARAAPGRASFVAAYASQRAARAASAAAPAQVSASFVLELLDRLAKVFKDYCGVLSEESIRKNFILVYELLDEVRAAPLRRGRAAARGAAAHPASAAPRPPQALDYGYPQSTSTETLKLYVHNEPVAVESKVSAHGGGMLGTKKTISSAAVHKPISLSTTSSGKKNEIFVDILERLTVLFNANVRRGESAARGTRQERPRRARRPARPRAAAAAAPCSPARARPFFLLLYAAARARPLPLCRATS